MTSTAPFAAELAPVPADTGTHKVLVDVVRHGLTCAQKQLPAWLFYDHRGSELFEQITTLPEYYLTRTERAIFLAEADQIIAFARHREKTLQDPSERKLRVLELGAGTASKTGILLSAAVRAQGTTHYLPIDVSPSALNEACASLSETLPQVVVEPQVANYVTEALSIPHHDGPTLALYIGSSIGNFSTDEAVGILRNLRQQLRTGDTLLLGTDLVKDVATLEAAYNDGAGVTAAFNRNILQHLNRELDANFQLEAFEHVACFNQQASRIEMHLRSKTDQTVHVHKANLGVTFKAGETIHTENSYKFTSDSIADLLLNSGFQQPEILTDPQRAFAVTLARV